YRHPDQEQNRDHEEEDDHLAERERVQSASDLRPFRPCLRPDDFAVGSVPGNATAHLPYPLRAVQRPTGAKERIDSAPRPAPTRRSSCDGRKPKGSFEAVKAFVQLYVEPRSCQTPGLGKGLTRPTRYGIVRSIPSPRGGNRVSPTLPALLPVPVVSPGLFPPAALPLDQAIRHYARYRREPDAWLLGRFVIQATRLAELAPYQDELFRDGSPFVFS